MNNKNNEKTIIETKEQLDKVITASVKAVVNTHNLTNMRVRVGFCQMIIDALNEACDIHINTVMCSHEYCDGMTEYWDEDVDDYIAQQVHFKLVWTNPTATL